MTRRYATGDKPKEKSRREFVFEKEFVGNSDMPLYENKNMKKTIAVKLPVNASKAHYDTEARAIKYVLPSLEGGGGFLSENRTLLSIIFGVSALFFAGLLIVFLRRTEPGPVAYTAEPLAPESEARFCAECGAEVNPGKKFCSRCGSPAE